MKNFLNKALYIFVVGVCVVLPVSAFVYSIVIGQANYDCNAGDDTCVDENSKKLRDLRASELSRIDEQLAVWTKTRKDTESSYNDRINALKRKRSTEATIKALQEGRKQDVPSELLTLKAKLIPLALADTSEVSSNNNSAQQEEFKGVTRWGDAVPVGRYGKVLADIGSPYAGVPIEQYCNKAGVKQDLCDVLVGITYAESNAGVNFACNWKSAEEAKSLGQNYYHNPAGYKDFTNDGTQKNPDTNGCYLRKFDSWDAFFEFYTAKMKTGYFDKGATTPASISRWYVGGDGAVKYGWVSRVLFMVDSIQKANS